MSTDIHSSKFDEGTLAKLNIFKNYAKAWLPTFIVQKKDVYIFDFFAGSGYDKEGQAGSPILILETINSYINLIYKYNIKVHLILNEFEPNKRKQTKFQKLKESCKDFLENNPRVKFILEIEYFNKDFAELFFEILPKIKNYPSLVYLDQYGIKFLDQKYLLELEKIKQVDFLYYVSSSYFKRFGASKEFKSYFQIDLNEINNTPYKFIHRIVLSQLKKKLPKNSKLKLYPFSILKGKNIYGIIFGSKHPLAVSKFLDISWKENKINGEANFDITEENTDPQFKFDFFNEEKKLSKVKSFQQNVKDLVLKREICNNFDLLEYTFNQAHIPSHADEILRELKKQKLITYDCKSPLVNYKKVYKDKIKLEYTIL